MRKRSSGWGGCFGIAGGELEFSVKYDIKYRMGKTSADEEAE